MDTTQVKVVRRKQNLKRFINNCFILFILVQIMVLLLIDYFWNLPGLCNRQVRLYALKRIPSPSSAAHEMIVLGGNFGNFILPILPQGLINRFIPMLVCFFLDISGQKERWPLLLLY